MGKFLFMILIPSANFRAVRDLGSQRAQALGSTLSQLRASTSKWFGFSSESGLSLRLLN